MKGTGAPSMSCVVEISWDHLVHFVKFPVLKFQKVTVSTVLIKSQPNFMESVVIRGKWFRLLLFWGSAKFKNFSDIKLKLLLTRDHMRLEISKSYSYSFHLISSKLYGDIGYHGGIQAITFLDNMGQVLKTLWHFDILTWDSVGKCTLSWKGADHRAKPMKIWDLIMVLGSTHVRLLSCLILWV